MNQYNEINPHILLLLSISRTCHCAASSVAGTPSFTSSQAAAEANSSNSSSSSNASTIGVAAFAASFLSVGSFLVAVLLILDDVRFLWVASKGLRSIVNSHHESSLGILTDLATYMVKERMFEEYIDITDWSVVYDTIR